MKTCKICGKRAISEYCFRHKPNYSLSRGGRIKIKKKEVNIEEIDKMWNFFYSIWRKRKNHKCEMCGKWLGNEPLSYMFDHILEKSKYPELKYEEDNIAYLCLLCHDSKTRGFPSEEYLKKIQETKLLFKK